MTGEEAKKWLNKLLARADITDEYGDMEDMQPYEEAVNMAIKDIETVEEFEKAQIITGGRLNGRTYAYKCGLEDGIRKALEREPKTGRWIERIKRDDWDDYEEVWYECDQCHVNSDGTFNYCSNCGAKMEKE